MSDSLNTVSARSPALGAGSFRTFRVCGRLVQPALNRVVVGAEAVQLEPKIMRVLLALVERAGDVVTKEELIERVWEGVFVSDDVLVRAIGELRRSFEDDGRPVIETIRKRGYRLVVPVVYDAPRAAWPAPPPRVRAGVPWFAIAAAVATVALAAAALVSRREPRPVASRFVPLTSLEGNEYDPALSPDGTRVAFAWDGGRDAATDIYVKMIGAEATLRLSTGEGNKRAPVWSPDGGRVAFLRIGPGACAIDVVSALGGPAQQLAACANDHHPRFAWSPDGGALAVTQPPRPGSPTSRIRIVAIDGSATREITADSSGDSIDTSPVFSPDGRRIAFIRELSDSVGDIFSVAASGGDAARLTFDNADIMGFTWIDGGRRLAFSSNRAGMYSLWAVAADGGEPALLAGGGRKMKHPSASRAGDALAYEAWNYDMNVWRLPLAGAVAGAAPATGERLAAATDEWSFEPRFSPDGASIVFVSTRSGSYELWLRRTDGLVRLTSFGGPFVGEPRFSHDGKRIVFVARPSGRADVFAVDLAGGAPQRLTTDPGDEAAPSLSADGAWLYFASRRSGAWQVHRRRLATGEESQLTQDGGYAALESADGRWLYTSRIDRAGLWRRPARGGADELVTGALRPEDWASWGVSPAGVYWLTPSPGDAPPTVSLLRPGSASPATIATLHEMAWPGIDLAPDASQLLYSHLDHRDSNVVLLSLGPRP